MSDFYNAFGQFVSTQTIETFVNQADDKIQIDNTKILNNIKVLKVQIETGTLTKEQVITEIEKLNSLKKNKDTSDEVKNAIELLVKDTVSKVDGIRLEGNMEISGVMKSRGFYLTDGTKIDEVTRVVNKLAVPFDKEGNLAIVPSKDKKVTINDLHVTSNTGLKVTGHGKTSSFGSLNSGWCHITTNAPNFHMNKKLTIEGGINATGGRTHFKDVENRGRVRVGAAWGIPGFYSEDNQDIVVGVPRNRKVNLGTTGKFVEIDGKGNMKIPGKFCINNTCITEADLKEMIPIEYKFTDTTIKTAVNEWIANPTKAIKKYGHIKNWDTRAVTSMYKLFYKRKTFNDDISNWNVSKVKSMHYMFTDATAFNQPIGNWNVSNVILMRDMFRGAKSFNQPIGNWNVSKVTNMSMMFQSSNFNQPIGNWNVSNVKSMMQMFANNRKFNQNLNNWTVYPSVDTGYMFYGNRRTMAQSNVSKWRSKLTEKVRNNISSTYPKGLAMFL